MGPWGLHQVIRHSIFRIAIVEDVEATEEFRAFPAPACVVLDVAVGAEFRFVGATVGCSVLIATSPTCVRSCHTIAGDMTKFLAFGAFDGFLPVLSCREAFVADV